MKDTSTLKLVLSDVRAKMLGTPIIFISFLKYTSEEEHNDSFAGGAHC